MLKRSLAWTFIIAVVVIGVWQVLDLPKYVEAGCPDFGRQDFYKCTVLHVAFVPFWYLGRIAHDLDKEILAAATVFIAIFTIGLTVSTAFLWKAGERHSARQLLARMQGVAEHHLENYSENTKPIVRVVIKNFGQTPAYDFVHKMDFDFYDVKDPIVPLHSFEDSGRRTLNPQDSFHIISEADDVISAEEMAQVAAGLKFLIHYGNFQFRDAFGVTRKGSFKMYYGGWQTGKLKRMAYCLTGNDAD